MVSPATRVGLLAVGTCECHKRCYVSRDMQAQPGQCVASGEEPTTQEGPPKSPGGHSRGILHTGKEWRREKGEQREKGGEGRRKREWNQRRSREKREEGRGERKRVGEKEGDGRKGEGILSRGLALACAPLPFPATIIPGPACGSCSRNTGLLCPLS